MAPKNQKRLFVIDGAALAYRTHFALANRPLINSKGLNTSAVFGFTNALMRILEKEKPDYLAVAFDSKEPTFRHEIYQEYKATREKMPDDLADQIPYIEKVVRLMNIPFLVQPGYEADDIIGTMVRNAEKEDCCCYIVSGDKDFMQLIDDNIVLYSPGKAKEPPQITSYAEVEEKFGVKPTQVTDVLALIGDSSDNVPGVNGVGPKTAGQLIRDYGSVENLLKAVADGKISNKNLNDKLQAGGEQLKLSKELVTIKTDLPTSWKLHDLKPQPWNQQELAQLFRDLEFRTLEAKALGVGKTATPLSEVKEDATEAVAESATVSIVKNYHLVDSAAALRTLIVQLKKSAMIVVDTETTDLEFHRAKMVGIAFSMQPTEAYYVDLVQHPEWLTVDLKPLLEDPKIKKGGHNLKYDLLVLRQNGVRLQGVAFDSMIESYLLDATLRQHNLDLLALRHLQFKKISIESLLGKGKEQITMEQVPPQQVAEYACEDADVTLRLHQLFTAEISKQKLDNIYENLELPLLTILSEMEYEGINIDIPFLNKLSKQLEIRIEELTKTIHTYAGGAFNIQSTKQLGEILFERLAIHKEMKVTKIKKTKTGYSTDVSVLETLLPHPMIVALMEYRNLSKLKSTYTDTLPELVSLKSGKIHTHFNQTITATGRLSSSDPNLQNIPIRTEMGREIRKAFIAPDAASVLISADYSQIELRILAHLSEDRDMIRFFQEDHDIHAQTAKKIFKLSDAEAADPTHRSRAKAINFGILYGMGPQRLAKETGVTLDEAGQFIDSYFRSFPKVGAFIEATKQFARDHGFTETMLKRRRHLPEIHSNNPRLLAEAERIAVNTPIQGSAADLIKLAMINLQRRLLATNSAAKLLLQVHDELVLHAPKSEAAAICELVKSEMQNAMSLRVPLKVEVGYGSNWLEAHA